MSLAFPLWDNTETIDGGVDLCPLIFHLVSCLLRMFRFLLLLASLTASQSQECTFGDPIDLRGLLSLRQFIDPDLDRLTIEVTYEGGEAWVGLGFGAGMLGSQAIIGVPALDSVDTYNLGGFSVDDVVPTGGGALAETSLIVSEESTVMTISAPFRLLGIQAGSEVNVIYAHGQSGELEYHGPDNKGKGTVTFTNCVLSDPTDPPVATTAAPVSAPSAMPSVTITDAPTSGPVTNPPTASPTTSDPTQSPVTEAPSVSPITDSPMASPITDDPTESPITDGPTGAPVTDSPTGSPIEAPAVAPTIVTPVVPSDTPTISPSSVPAVMISSAPSNAMAALPTATATASPVATPTINSSAPVMAASMMPSVAPVESVVETMSPVASVSSMPSTVAEMDETNETEFFDCSLFPRNDNATEGGVTANLTVVSNVTVDDICSLVDPFNLTNCNITELQSVCNVTDATSEDNATIAPHINATASPSVIETAEPGNGEGEIEETSAPTPVDSTSFAFTASPGWMSWFF